MFTGLVTAIGEISGVRQLSQALDYSVTIQVNAQWLMGVNIGDSVAINGACMTVNALEQPNFSKEENAQSSFTFVISHESVKRTYGLIDIAAKVHLEKSLRAQDYMGGHMVSGHIDGKAEIMGLEDFGQSKTLTLFIPEPLHPYCALKGSICIHGVSLTINKVIDTKSPKHDAIGALISINLIPHTLQNTNFAMMRTGAYVNIEIDMVARYVERLLSMTRVDS